MVRGGVGVRSGVRGGVRGGDIGELRFEIEVESGQGAVLKIKRWLMAAILSGVSVRWVGRRT